MAVPKKKLSVSRKRIRLNSTRYKMQNYTKCSKCSEFLPLHRKCECERDLYSTNILKKYNSNFLW